MTMTCDACGGMLELLSSEGATVEGHFAEEYQCVVCNLTMTISGDAADPPSEWDKHGAAYSHD